MPSVYRSPESLATVSPRWTPPGSPSGSPTTDPEIRRLRTALEDIIALANGSGETRERLVQMQRRAMAALSGIGVGSAESYRGR